MTCLSTCLCRCQQIGCGCRDALVRPPVVRQSLPAEYDDSPTALDRSYPRGEPDAITCRGCQRVRVLANGALFCRVCDGEGLRTAERKRPA